MKDSQWTCSMLERFEVVRNYTANSDIYGRDILPSYEHLLRLTVIKTTTELKAEMVLKPAWNVTNLYMCMAR